MVELFEQDTKTLDRQSSKGNQLKWTNQDIWYKADYCGYEGLSEYLVSHLMQLSNLKTEEYVLYETEEIVYKKQSKIGCKSQNFLLEGWELITLEKLFRTFYGESLNHSIYTIKSVEERASFLVEQVIRITNLKEFGVYLSKLLTVDAIFLNEDRHTHNIAVLKDPSGVYHYCPIFDNGASLLSDTSMDYPLNVEYLDLMKHVKAKTMSTDFDEQLDAVEHLYGQHLQFHVTYQQLKELLDKEPYYPEEVKKRVLDIILYQRSKYTYLFTKQQ